MVVAPCCSSSPEHAAEEVTYTVHARRMFTSQVLRHCCERHRLALPAQLPANKSSPGFAEFDIPQNSLACFMYDDFLPNASMSFTHCNMRSTSNVSSSDIAARQTNLRNLCYRFGPDKDNQVFVTSSCTDSDQQINIHKYSDIACTHSTNKTLIIPTRPCFTRRGLDLKKPLVGAQHESLQFATDTHKARAHCYAAVRSAHPRLPVQNHLGHEASTKPCFGEWTVKPEGSTVAAKWIFFIHKRLGTASFRTPAWQHNRVVPSFTTKRYATFFFRQSAHS